MKPATGSERGPKIEVGEIRLIVSSLVAYLSALLQGHHRSDTLMRDFHEVTLVSHSKKPHLRMHLSKVSDSGKIRAKDVGRYLILLLLVFLVSCVSSDYLILEDGPVACGWNDTSVEFLQEAPKRPFIKVAVVEATKLWWAYASWEDLRQAICREAVTVGADAIIEVTSAKSRYDATFGFVGTSGDTKQLRGIAIRYKQEALPLP